MTRRIALETWDPDYGAPTDAAVIEPSDITINSDLEMPASQWRPVTPDETISVPEQILFIDGVRRTDAYAWITEGNEPPFRAVFASYAAGAALVGKSARVTAAKCRRVLITIKKTDSLMTRAGAYETRLAAGSTPDELSQDIQNRLTTLEIEIAQSARGKAELIVIDGPLRGRQDLEGALGFVKTHRVSYLPEELQHIVADLRAGQRTPVFMFSTSWSRYSWYLRLPGPAAHAWWGIVRIEAAADMTAENAVELGDRSTVMLQRYASVQHKDPRAPQNLYPIAALERELRRRLGDPAYVERCLRMEAG